MTAEAPPQALEAQLTLRVGSGDRLFAVEAELGLSEGVLVLFGPSGVGKTLTLQALAGLIEPVSGFVRIGGRSLFDSSRRISVAAHRRHIGYVPQQQALFPFLDVAGNVAFGLPRAERRRGSARVSALLEELGLAALGSSRPGSLSGGERQRAALARALAVEPRLLLLDEPFASIDREGRASLWTVLREAIDRRRMPAVMVTHDAEEAIALGDRVVLFERGRTTVAGEPRAVLGGGEPVIVMGQTSGAAEAAGSGRARIRMREAVIEGPAEIVKGEPGEALRIELDARGRSRSPG